MFYPIPPPSRPSLWSDLMGGWRTVCRLCGVLIVFPTSLWTLVGSFFLRIENAGDYDSVLWSNVVAGGMFALAFVLFCAPHLPGAARWRFALVATIAMLIWAVVSGSLIWQLEEHMRIRSMQ